MIIAILILFLLFVAIAFYKESNGRPANITLSVETSYVKTTEQELSEEYDYWKKKCARKADRFLECYKTIISAFYLDEPNADSVMQAKNESINLLRSIYETSYEVLRYSYSYTRLRSYLGSNWKPFMQSNAEFREEIEWMAEYAAIGKARKDICSDIIKRLEKKDIMRSQIKKVKICGATEAQISSCCKYLLSNNIIVEYKNEQKNRYFYKLKDKK